MSADGHNADKDAPDFPCCEHCEPDCWARTVGHGCSCLDCEPRPIPPECHWCGDPATELRDLGRIQQRPQGPWRPITADLCTPCAIEADDEKARSQTQ